ncbi:histidine kinase [Sorangium cellulosum]|uniref:histidine kinase n=1 Tax=Sorangium cellulosum TaxID=56 RepID=A0A2L0EIH3_SORCE|nr:PAS domain-containing sensor histidine kinase [Sorangium cellulosum]AUX39092.1 histidine kinase [Sorangium cellulosum]
MAEASLALSGEVEPAGARRAIVAAALRLLHAETACLYVVSREPPALELAAEAAERAGGTVPEELRRLPLDGQSLAAAAARAGLVEVAPEGEGGAALADADALRGPSGSALEVAAPIHVAGDVRAVLVCSAARPELPEAEVTELLRALAGLFGMALGAAESRALRARVEALEQEKRELERARERLSAAIADARETEAALRLSEDSLARAQKLVKLGNWDWRIPKNELLWSDECYSMLGLSREAGALTYERFLACIHPEDRGSVMHAVDLALAGEAPFDVEYRILRPGGEERLVHTQADVLRADDGTPVRMIGTALDVTEQRRAEMALRLSEERLRVIAEHASDVIFRMRLGPGGGYEYISPAVLDHTGYPPEAWYEDPELFVSLVHPEDTGRYWEFVERMAAAGGRLIFRIIDRSGRVRWLSTHITIQRDEAGRPIAGIGISRDVTTEKLADEEREQLLGQLAAERSWLNAVIERSPVGILLLDAGGAQIAWNRRAQELAGTAAPPDLSDPSYLRLPDGQPLSREEQPSVSALRGEVTTARELSLRREGGSAVPVVVSAGPIVDASGQLLGAVVVFDDITQIKELDQLREEWTSVVAHDLKQPVTTIIGYAAQIERKPQVAAAVKTRAGHIVSSAKRLGRMVSDLTDISQLESRRLAIERAPVDLQALVEAVVERTASETAGHTVEIAVNGEIPIVYADAGRVEQILSNLLSNAAKYGELATPIRASLERRGDEVQVSVENAGRGIPQEDLPMLFERFFRGKARGERVVGLGLGLYIAKGLVEAHHGRIWAESPRGGPTTFHFTLPIGAPPAQDSG